LSSFLEVKDLSFSWGPSKVLKKVNLSIKPNQLVSILGVNGVGKTTLLKCLNRILIPQTGKVEVLSKNISDLDLISVSKLISYVPQTVLSSFAMDVFDVVMLGRRPHIAWNISDGDREKVSETLTFFNFEDFAFRRFDQLSGGEKQKVIIAKAVAQDSSIFLMDEPTSDLDLKNQIEVMQKIKELLLDSDSDKSAIIATHDMNIAARFSDYIFLMDDGTIKAEGTPEDVLTSENIADVFGVDCEILPKTDSDPLRIFIRDSIIAKKREANNDKE
tara:strand:- start:245 stop:1066 length:822 start_codon:yes stop_codon:yes gene_type:complete